MSTTVTSKGQVTIPKAIRDDLGLTPGAVLDFQEDHGVIIVRKIVDENPISAWRGRGCLPERLAIMDYLTATRGE